ncbi:hypothetical protein [Maioricimonas sp. JC845]|uniref:hypothetical protein n=1 Tax=Maioricimonas sp. JC845 TaxID=3232138 RepID=UPI00345AEE51
MTDVATIEPATATPWTLSEPETDAEHSPPSEPVSPAVAFRREWSRLPPFPRPWRHPLRSIGWIVRTLFGLASLTLLLAVVAAVPILNFIALGYLLEAEGRVARTGRLRRALPLLNLAPRIGTIALGIWICLLPLRFIGSMTSDAALIDPGSAIDERMRALALVAWAMLTVHICLALARGGSPSCFLRPIRNVRWLRGRLRDGDYFAVAATNIRQFIRQLRIRHHFWLGLRGFVGAFLWLLPPTALYAAVDRSEPGPIIVSILGGLGLVIVFGWVPFLQAHFAATERFGAFRELKTVRTLFRYAPLSWLLALVLVYVLALPLYLFKVLLPPRDAMWGITLVFLVSIFPARMMTGWAYAQAVLRKRDDRPAHWVFRWTARLAAVPLLAAYVFILYFTQFIGAHGKGVLYEHHAFLLPWPAFLSLGS